MICKDQHSFNKRRPLCSAVVHFLAAGLFLTCSASAQDLNQQIRRARQLDRSGRRQEALEAYESLYAQEPDNLVIFNNLLDLCIRGQHLERARGITEIRRQKYPNDPNLEVALARIDFKMGRQDAALTRWRALVEKHPEQSSVYQLVAGSMIQERLLDDAVEIYLLGRKRIGKDDLFVFNLASLYGALIQYGKATEELLRYFKIHPQQVEFIQRELLRYPNTDNVVRQVEDKIRSAIAKQPDNAGLKQLLVGLYVRSHQHEKAFAVTREMEELTEPKKKGEALFRLAQTAFRESASDVTEKAYREILDTCPDFGEADRVRFGLARALEAQGKSREAVENYRDVARFFPVSALAAQALFRKGLLERDMLRDSGAAAQTFRQLVSSYSETKEGKEARLALGACLVLAGDVPAAGTLYSEAVEVFRSAQDPLWLTALVRLADAAYLQGRFEEALDHLKALNPKSVNNPLSELPDINDGLALRLLVQEHNARVPELLQILARSDLLARRGETGPALAALDSIVTARPDDPITAEALFRKGSLLISVGQMRESLSAFDSLLIRFPAHLLADRALERSGWILETTGQTREAVQRYEMLLTDYPQSFLVEDVRRRIRGLEKEVP